MRFRFSIYADINVDENNFAWNSIEDAREVAKVVAEETVKFLSEECKTGAYNPYLGGVAHVPFGTLETLQAELERL